MYFMALLSVNVHMPKDRVTQTHQGYGFVEFMGEEDADYAIKVCAFSLWYQQTSYIAYKISSPVMCRSQKC